MKSKKAIIHIETLRDNKTRWVKQAQRQGKNLSTWITDTLNANSTPLERLMLATISIPNGIDFADLKLSRDQHGNVRFDWAPIIAICKASKIDPALLQNTDEDNVSEFIIAWYSAHLNNGGDPDATAEDLSTEVKAEIAKGQHASHKPGRA